MALGVQIASLVYIGTAQLDDIFGFYQAPSAVQIQRLQMSAQVGPVGGNVSVELVDEAGIAYGAEIAIISASTYRDVPLAAPITLSAGDIVRAKITGVDLGVGGYLTLNLIGATSQGPVGPCCCGPYAWGPMAGCCSY